MEELGEKYIRLAAEYDNFRKRTQREKEALTSYVVSETAAKFLPLFDSLTAAASQKNAAPEQVADGLEKVILVLQDAMTNVGIEEIDTSGTFNPELHNAVMHVEDETAGKSEVVEVFQKGYRHGDKVIRHAMVKVAN